MRAWVECGIEEKERGSKTERKRQTGGSNEFPGQNVFFTSESPVNVPVEQIITPVSGRGFPTTTDNQVVDADVLTVNFLELEHNFPHARYTTQCSRISIKLILYGPVDWAAGGADDVIVPT